MIKVGERREKASHKPSFSHIHFTSIPSQTLYNDDDDDSLEANVLMLLMMMMLTRYVNSRIITNKSCI